MATDSRVLSKGLRLFVGNTATPANDTAFTLIENENALTLSYSADLQEIATKSGGKRALEGDESWEIKGDFNEAFADTGLPLLESARNTVWKYQIRDTNENPDVVWMEGNFILSDMEYKMETQGVREGSFTLKSSGTITVSDRPGRAIV